MTVDLGKRTLIGAAGALALGGVTALAVAKPKPRVIRMVAKKWVYVPGVVKVRKGESVLFRLTAPEVPMGFSLPDFGRRRCEPGGGSRCQAANPTGRRCRMPGSTCAS